MRIVELISEARLGTLNIGGILINVDSHVTDQIINRKVNQFHVDKLLKKIPQIKSKLEELEPGQQFWIYDLEFNVAVGFRKGMSSLYLKTVVNNKPWNGPTPVITIGENFADGKNPGRKGLAKRSGVNTKASVSSLRKTAKNSSGEKQRMAHWLANMKAGRAKKK
jgi:hypothetical protein